MKKVLSLLLVLGLCFGLTGCGGNDSNSGSDSNKKTEQKKETDFEIVSKVFTLEKYTADSGTVMSLAKDGDAVKFKMYMELSDSDKKVASAMGIEQYEIVYCVNGTDSETYLVNLNKTFVTFTDATAETMKADMDKYLSEKGLTIDQIKNALKEVK